LSDSELAANIPKLNGRAMNDSEIRRFASIIEDQNHNIEY